MWFVMLTTVFITSYFPVLASSDCNAYLFHGTVEKNLPIAFVSIFRDLYRSYFGYFQKSVQKVNEVRIQKDKIIQTLTVQYFLNSLYLKL